MFARLTPSPEQKKLEELVEKKGGPGVIKADENALKELLELQSVLYIGQANYMPSRGSDDAEHKNSDQAREVAREDAVKALKQELLDHPTLSIDNNLKVFNRKFDMQLTKLDEVKRMVHVTLKAVKAGAHDGINETVRKMVVFFLHASSVLMNLPGYQEDMGGHGKAMDS